MKPNKEDSTSPDREDVRKILRKMEFDKKFGINYSTKKK